MKNQNKDKMKKLSEFCEEYGFDQDQVRKENDDIIVVASGEEFIDEQIFFNQLPQRGRPLSRKKRGRKKPAKVKGGKRVWQGDNRGRLKTFIKNKTDQINRLNGEISILQKQIDNLTEPDPELEYQLHTLQIELVEAEEELEKAKNRDAELLEKRKQEAEKKTK